MNTTSGELRHGFKYFPDSFFEILTYFNMLKLKIISIIMLKKHLKSLNLLSLIKIFFKIQMPISLLKMPSYRKIPSHSTRILWTIYLIILTNFKILCYKSIKEKHMFICAPKHVMPPGNKFCSKHRLNRYVNPLCKDVWLMPTNV